MVSPLHFGFNPQTAKTNPFQHKTNDAEAEVQRKARFEFDGMVEKLQNVGVRVLILPSRKDVLTPDSIFPNNWFSHHCDGTLVVYPMLTKNRREERQVSALIDLLAASKIPISRVLDLTALENEGFILEGTGSLVLDRTHHVAFSMESPRTTRSAFDAWCKKMKYKGIFFHAYDEKHFPIYHTNVTMNIGDRFAVVCLESIQDTSERNKVESTLTHLGKEVIPITKDQMLQFCGNVLQVLSGDGTKKIVMSETAFSSFTEKQLSLLQKSGEIIAVSVPTIETVGGGSARCMLAEVFPS